MITISVVQATPKDSLNSPVPRFFISFGASGSHLNTETILTQFASTTINVIPFFGYRIDRFVFGFGFNNSYYKKNSVELDLFNGFYNKTESGKEFSLMPTVKYYSKINVIISASYIYGKGFGDLITPVFYSYGNYNVLTSSKSEIVGAAGTIGYTIKAGKSFLIEPHVGFNYTTINTDYTERAELAGYNLYTYSKPYSSKYSHEVNRKEFLVGIGITYRF